VTSYLAYAMRRLGIRCDLADWAGGLAAEQVALLRPADVMLAISFTPYAQATVDLASAAFRRGIKVIAITDSPFSPLIQAATAWLEVAEADLELSGGRLQVVGAPQLGVPLGELSRILQGAPGYPFPPGMEPGLQEACAFRTDALTYANACHAAEVEVDIESGEVHLMRYVALQDSGILVNPLIVDGQVHGGIAHGVGNALLEWMGYDDSGQPLTANLGEYMMPTATSLPMFETQYRQTPSPLNPLGAKGAGEVGTIPAAAAVICAIEDALSPLGVRITRSPVTPAFLAGLIAEARRR